MRVAALIIAVVLVALIYAAFFSAPARLARGLRAQMRAGHTYMKSLKESDIPIWVERTKQFLAENQPGDSGTITYGTRQRPVPSELAALKIIRIDVAEDQVRYVWMGGMDHTELEVHRLADGTFTLIAHYNDQQSEVIWPKRPNHAVERTAAGLLFYTLSS